MAKHLKIGTKGIGKLFGIKMDTFIQGSRSLSPSQKAEYHQVSGAGRSHVTRKFMGLTSDDKEAIRAQIGAYVTAVVRSR